MSARRKRKPSNVVDMYDYLRAKQRSELELTITVDASDGAVLLSFDGATYSLTPRTARKLARHIGFALVVLKEGSNES